MKLTHPNKPERRVSSNITPTGLPPTGYIRQSKLIPTIVPVSPATLWRWVKSGHFPTPHKLGKNTTAWHVADVRQWLDAMAQK